MTNNPPSGAEAGESAAAAAEQTAHASPFADLGLSTQVVRPLEELGLLKPTPIQRQAIPLVLKGHDVMGLAQTGTGKTAAFGLPLIERLILDGEKPIKHGVRALILAPTRELVNQIADNLRPFAKPTRIWVSSVVGGQSIKSQVKHLMNGTDILVATPGRLLDLVERKAVRLDTVKYLVLDEADQMLDMGFIHALNRIAKMLGKPRQSLLFSATMPKEVERLSRSYQDDPVRVEVAPPGKTADKIKQSVHYISSRDKTTLLKKLLEENPDALSLVFSRTKHGAEKMKKHLVESGFDAVSIHGNKSQGQRDRALKEFRAGEARILVATDVAARGIDIPGVTHVYNYNLPEVAEAYVHRIGRTARAGRDGLAVAFCAPDERPLLQQIERLIGITLEVASTDGTDALPPTEKKGKGRSGGGNKQPNKGKRRKPPQGGVGQGRQGPKKQYSAADSDGGFEQPQSRDRSGGGEEKSGARRGQGKRPAGQKSGGPNRNGPSANSKRGGGGRPTGGKPSSGGPRGKTGGGRGKPRPQGRSSGPSGRR